MQRIPLTKLFSDSGQKLLRLQGWNLTLNRRLLVVDPDIMFLSRPKLLSLVRSSSSLTKSGGLIPFFRTFSTRKQLNSKNLSIKLERQDIFSQSPAKYFTCRAEEETVQIEGVGWAGQPIVKRLHTILPEVHGSDILKTAKKTKIISEVGNNLEIKVRNFGRSHDIIAVINKRVRNKLGNKSEAVKLRNDILHAEKEKMYLKHSGILVKNPKKLKKKKRTVVLASKPGLIKNPIKRKLHKKKKAFSHKQAAFSKGFKIKPTMVINRRLSTIPSSRSLVFIANRHLQTFSVLNSPKATITGQSKKGKSSKNVSVPIIPEDDCVCPEILYTTGKRKSTKICGEAAGVKTKKKSSWKQKMCLVGPKEDPGRPKTFVCLSEAAKIGKRKKELPKCPEPEKLVAPRVIICAPNLIDEQEAKKKKECVKIEEVKVRKRTKVCKPVIIFAKEEVGIKAEKKICTSTRIKKVVSRHTKICPPE